LSKAASPAHWRLGLQSWNLAPHVGGTGRLNGSEIAQIDSDGGRLYYVASCYCLAANRNANFWDPILGEREGAAGRR